MACCTHLRLYLVKTAIQKKRHCGSTLCEIFTSVALLVLFAALYKAVPVDHYATETFECDMDININDENSDAVALGTLLWGSNQMLGVTGTDPALVTSFLKFVNDTYPGMSADVSDKYDCQFAPLPLGDYIIPFSTPAALDDYTTNENYGKGSMKPLWAGIVLDRGAPDWAYTLRLNYSSVPDPTQAVNELQRNTDDSNQHVYFSAKSPTYKKIPIRLASFVPLQLMVDKFIIHKQVPIDSLASQITFAATRPLMPGCSADLINATSYDLFNTWNSLTYAPQFVEVAPFPQTAFQHNQFYTFASNVLAMFFVISFLFPASRLIRGLVLEKETKIREGVRMMGMSDIALFSSWYITYIIMFTIVAVLVSAVTSATMFPNSSALLLFFYFFLFGASSVAVCFFLHTFFSRSKIATTVGTVVFLAMFFPYYAVNSTTSSMGSKQMASLLPSVAFALSLDVLATLEDNGVGATLSTTNKPFNNFTFSAGLFMMFFDFFLYTLLGWYLDNIIPSEFGVPKPFYYCCQPRYYANSCCLRKKKPGLAPKRGDAVPLLSAVNSTEVDVEVVSDSVEDVGVAQRQLAAAGRCVAVRGLRKEFDTPDGIKKAVDGVDLTMYEGQIFALLGHNGAGKTTTISMLTGLLPSTAGRAYVFGQDISDSMADIRHVMGVCPQHDVLWDDLTVSEHLRFFAGLKGVPSAGVDAAVAKIIAEVGLTEKVNVQSQALSGGMKRKLSVAIALIGDSKVVFLDEPTSGMDPYSRRSTWNILQNAREGRIMILTTHFMDEADLLGDRIAIMAEGKVKCCGSSMFLKSKYGVGYNLTLVKAAGVADPSTIQSLIKSHVPESKVLSNVGAELSLQLPLSASARFPLLFSQLESDRVRLGIESYGISVTTLEEVFLKVAEIGTMEEREKDRHLSRQLSTERQRSDEEKGVDKPLIPKGYSRDSAIQGESAFFMTHFRALFRKRFRFATRDKKAICFQLVIPVIALLLGLILLKSVNPQTPPSTILSVADYNKDGSVRLPLEVPYWASVPSAGQGLMNYISQANGAIVPNAVNNVTNEYPKPKGYACAANTYENQNWLTAVNGGVTNLTMDQGYSMSEYLLTLKEQGASKASKYGAYILDAVSPDPSTTTGPLPADTPVLISYWLFENTTALSSTAVFINVLNSALFNWTNGGGSITVSSQEFALTAHIRDLINNGLAFTAVLFVIIAFSFIPASFAVFVVKEREVNAKHQQLISGVSIPAYWLSTFAWDIINYSLPCVLSIILILAFDIKQLVTGSALSATILLFVFYGTSVAAFTYCLTYLFKSHSTAQTVVLLVNLFCMVLLIAAFVMGFIDSTCKANQGLMYLYKFMPGFALGNGLIQLTVMDQLQATYSDCGRMTLAQQLASSYGPFSWIVAGSNLTYMAIETIVYFAIAVAIDVMLSHPALRARLLPDKDIPEARHEEDEDVLAEERRVASGRADDELIVLRNIRKVYAGGKVAVHNLSFGIPKGECFGFLGINGAGKTTTLKILSGDIIPTRGTARLSTLDILTQQIEVRRLLGYCPQFEALFELLTTREHLELYARIKGVPKPLVEDVVQQKLDEMDLRKFENKTAGSLSGGNKRKLSVAIAMIGDPPIVFLDEPSTGMDPVARRFMWNVIARIVNQNKQCSVILTTHSMEECEALCTRLGIMVGGRLRCMGSPQHLKNRFGQGFLTEIKINPPTLEEIGVIVNRLAALSDENQQLVAANVMGACDTLGAPARKNAINPQGSGWAIHGHMVKGAVEASEFAEWWLVEDGVEAVTSFVTQAFPGAALVERHGQHVRFKLPAVEGLPLSRIFGLFEENKDRLRIAEYSLSQTSLEQIFNLFAAQQEEETGAIRGFQ